MRRGLFFFLLLVGHLNASVLAADLSYLRSPHKGKTPCGIFLSSAIDSTLGRKVADLDLESLDSFVRTQEKIGPKLIYIDAEKGRRITNAYELENRLRNGKAVPTVDRPHFMIVGWPTLGRPEGIELSKKEFLSAVREQLKAAYGDDISVQLITRPTMPDFSKSRTPRTLSKIAEWTHYALQRAIYFPVLPQDFQRPTTQELKTAASKLGVSWGFRTLILVTFRESSMPWWPLIRGVSGDFSNSTTTGVFEKTMSNWMNRSANKKEFALKSLSIGVFFTSTMHILKNLSAKGLVAGQWFSVVSNWYWRNFLGGSQLAWEADYAKRVDADDARRTRNRLFFWTSVIAAPGFAVGVIFGKTGLGDLIASGLSHVVTSIPSAVTDVQPYLNYIHVNAGHAWMTALGTLGLLYSFPLVPKIKEGKLKFEKLSWDPWVARLDRIHAFNRAVAARIGADKFIDRLDQLVRGPERDYSINGDVTKFIDVDESIAELLQKDPELHKLIHEDNALVRIIFRDPHFESLRDKLLGPFNR